MGKPAYSIFVGVGQDGFLNGEENNLPEKVRLVYKGELTEYEEDGILFSCFNSGRHDTADPGEFVGFGVFVYGEWWDASTTTININEVCQESKEILEKVRAKFKEWGLNTQPNILNFCSYGS